MLHLHWSCAIFFQGDKSSSSSFDYCESKAWRCCYDLTNIFAKLVFSLAKFTHKIHTFLNTPGGGLCPSHIHTLLRCGQGQQDLNPFRERKRCSSVLVHIAPWAASTICSPFVVPHKSQPVLHPASGTTGTLQPFFSQVLGDEMI